ncbi:MAG TPA: ATP-binding protein [Leptospiraceae bacterium]|nr:ATP-binding protein [Leptospiraceae bacterium]HNF23519.1 ATP-binding protein [Leptospiraceae bacterium]HNI94520.1 ATP-binding protein [Leptospiraceae bacterium]HNM01776.1 ATP-binding protein [Leptospiraceae bacterium]HNN03935.1 ATP-binding protein [Leptospiraceae bacterium]
MLLQIKKAFLSILYYGTEEFSDPYEIRRTAISNILAIAGLTDMSLVAGANLIFHNYKIIPVMILIYMMIGFYFLIIRFRKTDAARFFLMTTAVAVTGTFEIMTRGRQGFGLHMFPILAGIIFLISLAALLGTGSRMDCLIRLTPDVTFSEELDRIIYVIGLLSSLSITAASLVLLVHETGITDTRYREVIERIQEKNEFINIVTSSLPVFIYVYDIIRKKTVYSNKSLSRYLGYEAEEFSFEEFMFKIHPEDVADVQTFFDGIFTSGNADYETEYRLFGAVKDYIWFSASYRIFQSDEKGKTEKILVLFQDISDRKAAESRITEARMRAEKAMKAKSEFLSVISHEIRTPLNSVIGFSNLLLQNSPREDQLKQMEILKFSAENLRSLVNEILDFSKMDAGKMELEKISFSLLEIMEKITESFRLSAESKGNRISLFTDVSADEFVLGDPLRLRQILANLVSNAVKFTNGGSISIHLKRISETEKNRTYFFSVEDTGIGIPAEKIPILFDKFTQVNVSTTREYGGTGLGLAICKKIAELMNTSISVESESGKGSKFFFTAEFPKAENIPELIEAIQPTCELKGVRALVVDDNEINTVVAESFLEKWGCRVDIADSGEKALQLLSKEDYNVILMDIQMPEMDGWQTSEAIRRMEDSKKSSVPIIALTAGSHTECEKEKSRLNGFVRKPFSPEELLNALKSVLNWPNSNH